MHYLLIFVAILLLAMATILRLYVGRRRFYRRSWSGLQVFRSYRQSIISNIFENFLLFVATACVIFAVIMVMIAFIH